MDVHRLIRRIGTLVVAFSLFLTLFASALYQIQIVDGAEYAARLVQKVTRTETVEAARGEIYDRKGRVLVYNELSYQVILNTQLMGGEEEINTTLLSLLDLCRTFGVLWHDEAFPITREAPYRTALTQVGGTARSRFQKLLETMKWEDEAILDFLERFQEDGTPPPEEEPSADDLIEQMRETFQMDPALSAVQARDLLGVRFELLLRKKDIARTDYLFAEGVDINFITAVKEAGLPGVLITPTTVRRYATPYAAHLLGRTGQIEKSDWEAYQAKGYAMNEIVGRDGVEKAFEDYLRGIAGVRAVETNSTGKVVSENWLTNSKGEEMAPRPGGHVFITIDLELQAAVEDILAAHIPAMKSAEGGAAVLIDVNTGEILASASYPSFDLSTYSEQFNQLKDDPLTPFNNRAFQGIYAPGSTFKMVTAIGGLEEGIITPQTQILDTGKYLYYRDYQPRCWIYRQGGGTHGKQNVSQAITNSCNVFFYDVGRRLGIEKLGQYARLFGLGEPTGVELPEKNGVVAGPGFTESIGGTWQEGSTLPAAIGQENNQFTPLQLANYIATLANGGKHYSAHLLHCVKSPDFSTVLYEREPELINTIPIDPKNLEAVKSGMLALTQTGSTARSFQNLNVKVGAKTGSVQVTGATASNATFVAFAPYDNPEVALAVVVEKGEAGAKLANIAADILAFYFRTEEAAESAVTENTLIQ